MSTLQTDALLGRLSSELILMCDEQFIVREANALARSTLGERIVGRPLLQIITTMARAKGNAFVAALRALGPDEVTVTWELLLHVPRAAPLLAGLKGGPRPGGGWVIMGSGETPGLSRLYHEVLSLNNELTDLVRQLTKEQATLSRTVNQLLQSEERHYADTN